MQKVEGSSPFSRLSRKPRSGGAFCFWRECFRRDLRPALPPGATTARTLGTPVRPQERRSNGQDRSGHRSSGRTDALSIDQPKLCSCREPRARRSLSGLVQQKSGRRIGGWRRAQDDCGRRLGRQPKLRQVGNAAGLYPRPSESWAQTAPVRESKCQSAATVAPSPQLGAEEMCPSGRRTSLPCAPTSSRYQGRRGLLSRFSESAIR
jgi:hypothetical protein